MEANQKCIVSYLPHALRFVEASGELIVEVPAGFDKKPFVVVTDEQLDKIVTSKEFKSFFDIHQLKIVDAIPKRYEDAVDQLAAARTGLETAKAEISAKDAQLADKDKRINELEELLNTMKTEASSGMSPERLKELQDRVAAAKKTE